VELGFSQIVCPRSVISVANYKFSGWWTNPQADSAPANRIEGGQNGRQDVIWGRDSNRSIGFEIDFAGYNADVFS
jgi:hypothetical protein